MPPTTHDTYKEAERARGEGGDGVVWKHDAGYYASTASHSDADELPEPEKWTEIEEEDW